MSHSNTSGGPHRAESCQPGRQLITRRAWVHPRKRHNVHLRIQQCVTVRAHGGKAMETRNLQISTLAGRDTRNPADGTAAMGTPTVINAPNKMLLALSHQEIVGIDVVDQSTLETGIYFLHPVSRIERDA